MMDTLFPLHRSGREQVVYSDRFIPSRSAAARRNFSALDRESAASESARYSDREVAMQQSFSNA